jgi:aminoglycoside phosphotransferase (APT) family kinase protein
MNENRQRRKMHDDEVPVGDSLVRRLIGTQFPQWSELALHGVPSTGTDNAIYRLGDEMGVRLPRIHWAVSQVDKEWVWLRRLAPRLPVAVPIPLAKGEPGLGYPYPWLVYPWIEGEDLQHAGGLDLGHAARDVAAFVVALQRADLGDEPPLGARAGTLALLDREARWAIGRLEGFDVDRVMSIWDAALRAEEWGKPPVWTHGDLLAANLIMRDGSLAGVIDWSGTGIGDPACDAQLAWFFPPEQRTVFLDALGFDAPTRARARGWVVWQTAMFIPYYAETIPDAVATAKLRLQAVLDDSDIPEAE